MTARYILAFTGLLLCISCSDGGVTTALPRPDTPPQTLASFNGTLQIHATDTYLFTVKQTGYVMATLIGLAAPDNTTVTIGIGTPSTTGTCALTSSVTTTAGPAAQLIGTGIAGSLCVSIQDIGNLTAPAVYTITVASS
jgi:hypothetical protein